MEENVEIADELIKKMLEKSQEAFLLAIEVYNKPTIKYRLEGFAFFVCNAWELLLKAYIIKNSGMQSIYYKDKPERIKSMWVVSFSMQWGKKAVHTLEGSPFEK